MTSNKDDIRFMCRALDWARGGLGRVAPNPSVGCVLVKDGAVIAEARTADGGRPHAEAAALEIAGDKARGATAYVSLEPCNTEGQSGRCVQKLIDAGIARVVIACGDPYQDKAQSKGVEALRGAGIEVVTGVLEEEAQALNEGFFLTVNEARPYISAKLATSLDARIATSAGESKWITGEQARAKGHAFRAQHDAILCGIGTVLADDPLLTARDDSHSIIRIVIDPSLKISLESQLVKTADKAPLWVIAADGHDAAKGEELLGAGVRVLSFVADNKGQIDVAEMLSIFAAEGITRLMVEGGSTVVSSFLRGGFVDRLLWFRAPILIGGDGLPAIQGLDIQKLSDHIGLQFQESEALGQDFLEIWKRKK